MWTFDHSIKTTKTFSYKIKGSWEQDLRNEFCRRSKEKEA